MNCLSHSSLRVSTATLPTFSLNYRPASTENDMNIYTSKGSPTLDHDASACYLSLQKYKVLFLDIQKKLHQLSLLASLQFISMSRQSPLSFLLLSLQIIHGMPSIQTRHFKPVVYFGTEWHVTDRTLGAYDVNLCGWSIMHR